MKSRSELQQVAHYLVVYDGKSEDLETFFELPGFELESFKLQFDVSDTDPYMQDRYAIGPDDTDFLSQYLAEPVEFKLSEKAYFIEALLKDSHD